VKNFKDCPEEDSTQYRFGKLFGSIGAFGWRSGLPLRYGVVVGWL
jgi:hypothetical protein